VTDAAVTMDFYPQPTPGPPKSWAFPVPERGVLANGLTVLRCHRPGQQVVAVEICLDIPLDSEPSGLDGIATIMVRALSQGHGDTHRRGIRSALERCGATLDARAGYEGARLSLEVPVSRLAKALELLRGAARARFATARSERWCATRLDTIPIEMATPASGRPSSWRRSFPGVRAAVPATARAREDTVAKIDAAGVRAFLPGSNPAGRATAVVVGDLTSVDLDAVLAGHARQLGRQQRRAAAAGPGDRQRNRARGDRRPARRVRRSCSSGGLARTGTIGMAVPCCRHVLSGRHAHVPVDRCYARRRATRTACGPLSRCCGRRRRTPGGVTGLSILAVRGSVDTAATGPALDDLWTVLRTLATEGLTRGGARHAVQNLVGVAPLEYETAAPVAARWRIRWKSTCRTDYQAQLYARLAGTSTAEATAAVVAAFPGTRLVTILVGDAAQIKAPVEALGIGPVGLVAG